MSVSEEEAREIRRGTFHIGALVSFGIFSVSALVALGVMINQVNSHERYIEKANERDTEDMREINFLQTQIQAINHKLQLKQDK